MHVAAAARATPLCAAVGGLWTCTAAAKVQRRCRCRALSGGPLARSDGGALYRALGLTWEEGASADAAQLKDAYRAFLKTVHPDVGGDEKQAREAVEAYAVLGDEQRRAAYDAGARPRSDGGDGG